MGHSAGKLNINGTYSWLPSQQKFHACEARFKGFSGPVGSGKSQALCREALFLAYRNPGRMGLLGAPTYPMLQATTQATLFEILEKERAPFEYHKGDNLLTLANRSRILFRPTDEVERLRGTNLAWFGIDELTYTKEEAWLRLEARLRDPKAARLCGFAVWTPKGYDWVYNRFIAETRSSVYETTLATPLENRHLAADYYEHLKASYDQNFYEQEVLGEYLNVTGNLVYSAFSRTQNVMPLEHKPDQPLLWSLDFNISPMSSVVVQQTGSDIRVLDEIVLPRATTMSACEEFLKRYAGHYKQVFIYGDASGFQEQTTSGLNDYEMVRNYLRENSKLKATYKTPRANPPVRVRVNLVNARLRSAAGDTHLFVDPKCKELIMDFEQVSFCEDRFEIDKTKDRHRTHVSDALGYLLCQEFLKPKPSGHRSNRFLT